MTTRRCETFERARSAVCRRDNTNSLRSAGPPDVEPYLHPCLRQEDAGTVVQCSAVDELLEETLTDIASGEPLTKRETQILQSIISGKSNKQIARVLCRSQRTIEYHRHHLMRKLNAHSPAELVRRAIAMGFA